MDKKEMQYTDAGEQMLEQFSDADEQMLERFFMQARSVEVGDNGFSRRVMQHLPERQLRLSRLWTLACVLVALVVFTLLGGWHHVLVGLLSLLTTVPTLGQFLQIIFCGIVLTLLAANELLWRERITFRSLV